MQKREDHTPIEVLENGMPELCQNFLRAGFADKSTLTRLNYAKDIKYFFEYAVLHYPYFHSDNIKDIDIKEVANITPLDIDRYLSYLSEKKYSDKTIARRKSSVSALFRYLVYTEQILKTNPIQGSQVIRIEEVDDVIYLKREEQEKLLNTIIYGTGLTERELKFHKKQYKRDLAIIYLFLDTGLRISELQGLDIKDIDLVNNELYTIRKGKKKKKDTIYYSDRAGEYIKEYLDERKMIGFGLDAKEPLFTSNRGGRIAIRTIETMLDKYVNIAFDGQKHISPHKLRSSFAMEFYRAQHGDILMLKKRMGHKSIISTNVYAKAFEKEAIKETRNWREE